jgi:UPF0755 protein
MKWGIIAAALLAAACNAPGAVERVPIPPGSTVRAAADSLAAHGVIRSTTWFRLRARVAGVSRSMRAGIYELARGAGTTAALRALRNGRVMDLPVTLPVGGTIFDLAHSAHDELGLSADSVIAAAHDTALLARYAITGPSAEGWLLPETFNFGGFDGARAVVARFAAARRDKWDSSWTREAAAQGFDRATLLTLASIVEAEASDSVERPLIAAVYRNRLRLRMPLQADPTIEYAYLLRDGQRKGRLYNGDYQMDSPWNTYQHAGLPPGPIDNPSRAAILATLRPAAVSYLYFVAGPDGHTLFATTYAEQLRNIARVRR